MKERPIIFNSEMVRAILEGRKMQTRRVIKPQPTIKPRIFKNEDGVFWSLIDKYVYQKSPFGTIGDRLWVKETWFEWVKNNPEQLPYLYKATTPSDEIEILRQSGHAIKWKPSLFMPRRALRISLENINIRVERLKDITEKDAKAEGVEYRIDGLFGSETGIKGYIDYEKMFLTKKHPSFCVHYKTAKESFKSLWNFINSKRGYVWDANPFVWVIEFKNL